MASNSRHLKRHSMPTAWPVQRKTIPFVSRPNPGSHKREYVVSVLILLRDVLGVARNAKEAKYISNNQEILVNGTRVKAIKHPVGLFDVIEIPLTKEKYVVIFDEFGKVKLVPSKDNSVILRVAGKKQVKLGKFQLNLMNGYNILVDEKTFKATSVQDSVVYDFEKKKVTSTIPLAAKTYVYLFDGKFQGQVGQITDFTAYNGLAKDAVDVTIDGVAHKTVKEYCYAIGTKAEDMKRFS